MLPKRLPAALLSPPTPPWVRSTVLEARTPRRISTSRCLCRAHDRSRKEDAPTPTDSTAGQPPAAPGPSLFEELFPGEKSTVAQTSQDFISSSPPPPLSDSQLDSSSSRSQSSPIPPDPSLAKWLHDPRKLGPRVQGSGRPPPPAAAQLPTATLILRGAPPGLDPSDLYRLATSSSAHLDGWAGGLLRASRALDPTTLAPRGRYALTFENRLAADAYLERARRLHSLGARAAHPGRAVTGAAAASELRAFALVPPSARLDARVVLPPPPPSRPHQQQQQQGADADEDDKAGRVLLVLEGGSGSGGGATPASLRRALDEDGRRRNLAWRLVGGGARAAAVVPVSWLAGRVEPRDGALGVQLADVVRALARLETQPSSCPPPAEEDAAAAATEKQQQQQQQRFSRFLVSFQDGVEGRRFAREWHRRRIVDETDGRDVTVNATLLW